MTNNQLYLPGLALPRADIKGEIRDGIGYIKISSDICRSRNGTCNLRTIVEKDDVVLYSVEEDIFLQNEKTAYFHEFMLEDAELWYPMGSVTSR